MSAVADKLAEARKLIERGWCQQFCAVDANGHLRAPTDIEAERFCAWGALCRVNGSVGHPHDGAFEALYRVTNGSPIRWNDSPKRTQAEVVEAFKRAEQIARGQVSA